MIGWKEENWSFFCAWGLSLFMAEPPFAEFITSRFD
jgi:hypothetical protein